MIALFSHALLVRLGLTVLHALWELAVLGFLLALGLALLRNRGPRAAYVWACLGLAAMVESVIGELPPADMGAVTGPAASLAQATVIDDLTRYGCDARSASTLLTATKKKTEWVHMIAAETLSGGHVHRVEKVGAGILDSSVGRVVSLPKTVGRELHTTFLPGSRENLARTLRELPGFLPSGTWD